MKEKRMSKEKRREQILSSAKTVFIDKGFNGATTVEIAKEAGISEVTLFRYFDSKKELFMESIKPVLFNSLEQGLNFGSNLRGEQRLVALLKERILFIKEERAVIKLILMESEINPELSDVNYIGEVTSLLNQVIKSLDLNLKNDDFVLRMLMGSILSFLYMPADNDLDIEVYVKDLIKAITL